MRVIPLHIWQQIDAEGGRNQWENVKQALHLSRHQYAAPMEKSLQLSPLADQSNV
jgi:hypothetical protein